MPSFPPVPEHLSFPKKEHEVLELWDKLDAFPESVRRRKTSDSSNTYVFYDGPPFATGLPHYGHFVASTLKDVVPRYFTMRGKYIERRFGWDTHGLPIEMETEKALGLSGPTEIRNFGVDKFNEACRSGVLRYTKEWRQIIRRLGRWVDFDNDYKTMDPSFMESVWWVFGEMWKKSLVYQDFRVMPYSWRLSTPLSNFEANSDYRDVQDPALTVKLELRDEPNTFLLIWTTTPWTLPSNVAVAVGDEIDYVKARKPNDDATYILAAARVEAILGKDAQIVGEMKGSALVGKRYKPLFNYLNEHEDKIFTVLASKHVTTTDGTGLVHMAPGYGEEDFQVVKAAGLPLLGHDFVDEEGRFSAQVTDFAMQNIKEADPKIIKHLKDAGHILRHDTIQHSYPFCWRSGTPLIYKAVPTWFVKVTALKEKLVANNAKIHWVPEFVGEKRFGNWLADAQDWSISRNRFWGTPIPLWICEGCNKIACISSVAELEQKTGESVTDLHSHYVDKLTFACECGEKMSRVPEVFDCWFDTGSVPYASVHYPFENAETFKDRFPAEYIAEGLDQTRAWFYTLLVLSTALFDSHPFKNVIVNGLVLAEDGSKMSKSKRNYPDPLKVLEEHGADALRAYLINSPVVRAEPLLFNEKSVKEVVRLVMIPLYHSWSFFVQYANIDGFDPKTDLAKAPNFEHRPELDRWLLSKQQSLVAEVNKQMEGYYLYRVIPPMIEFIDDLTNWYIRLSRRRFWKNADDEASQADKLSAYATMYEVLTTFTKTLAPVLPFFTETMYQNLVVEAGMTKGGETSVHFCDYPIADASRTDTSLEADFEVVRQVVKMGRALREKYRLKTRQPLRDVTVVTHDAKERAAMLKHAELIQQELNVKEVRVVEDDNALCTLVFKANFKTLGKRMGQRMKGFADAIAQFGRVEWDELSAGRPVMVDDEAITADDVTVSRVASVGVVVETSGSLTVALETKLDQALLDEGMMREVVSQLQKLRKDSDFDVTDRVVVEMVASDDGLRAALSTFEAHIASEVLATDIKIVGQEAWGAKLASAVTHDLMIDELSLKVRIAKV
jgi:isoleucyl-tRNA synthetase